MFRIIALAFAIARSSAYAYEDDHWEDDHHDDHHDEYTPWEFIFPDEVVIQQFDPQDPDFLPDVGQETS